MHVATQVKLDRFDIHTFGRPSFIDDVFPSWSRHDRFGIILDEAYGAFGASLLLMLSVAMFYEVDPTRRGRVYPESYAFHVGGVKASLAGFDVFPWRKEVEVADDPAEILDALNDRGITRLAVIDGPVVKGTLNHAEPSTARDRIVTSIAYSPSGRAPGGDVELAALDDRLTENLRCLLDPESNADLLKEILSAGMPHRSDERSVPRPYPRLAEPEIREPIRQAREQLVREDGRVAETFRRIGLDDALGMLGSRASREAAAA